jgi:hypothetical protein
MYNQAYKAYKGLPKVEDAPVKKVRKTGLLGRSVTQTNEQAPAPKEPKDVVANYVHMLAKARKAFKDG